jgi:hypothetical protein
MVTQTDEVLDLLRDRGEEGLTPLDAMVLVGTMRLAARISDAKQRLEPGEVIDSERYTTPNGKVVARYVLRHRDTAVVELELGL